MISPLLLKLGAGAALVVAAVAGLQWWTNGIEARGYERGRAEVQALRDRDTTQRAQEDTARVRATLRLSEAHREEEARREAAKQKEVDDAKQLAVRWAKAAAAADLAAGGLRDQLATFVSDARARPAAAGSDVAQRSATAGADLDLLADLYRGADARAGELAKALDVSRAAGLRCERLYDALTP